ncbi:MAG: DHH family phosphoesterase [Clostridia bacterium]|nr:DHH family phosphoesterase [Clostridia bacterium]
MENKVRRNKIWVQGYVPDEQSRTATADIAAALGLTQQTAQVLYNRGCRDAAGARAFLEQSAEKMHDPFLLKDVDRAVARIRLAIERHERIAIYGDYDVDGVTSVSVLYLFLSKRGADVGYYIPSRIRDGYGVTAAAIDMLAEERGVNLIITVDTGITAIDEVKHARERGVDMVITDHHECHAELPDACAVVNPHRADCDYPFKELAGVGVVFKLLCAYEMTECLERGEALIEGAHRICSEYADLVALGTIADVMPIIDENRIIVSYGLHMIANTRRRGLSALIDAALPSTRMRGGFPIPLTPEERIQQRKKRVNSGFVGFGLAPRINAAGRISTASKAVELLLADTDEQAVALAQELCEINVRRQVEENRVAEQAYAMIEESVDFDNDRIIVLDGDNWPQGIIGIVSSRVTERYGLPSILISFDGSVQNDTPTSDDIGKGSGRSIKGMNLVESLMACDDLLIRFGGHELAAGMSIARGNIERFRRRINEVARAQLGEEQLALQLNAECELEPSDMTMRLAEELERMEPFGVANPTPQFIANDMTVSRIIAMGGGKHTKLLLTKGDFSIYAVYFGISPAQLHMTAGERVDVLFQLSINEFQNERTLQMIVQDLRKSDAYLAEQKRIRDRYEEIRAGAILEADEEIYIPTREDFALVYTFLRREYRQGNTTYSDQALLLALESEAPGKINYIKLKYIIRVLQELRICGVSEPEEGYYIFDIYFTPSKTSIDKSSILKKLRSQCRRK